MDQQCHGLFRAHSWLNLLKVRARYAPARREFLLLFPFPVLSPKNVLFPRTGGARQVLRCSDFHQRRNCTDWERTSWCQQQCPQGKFDSFYSLSNDSDFHNRILIRLLHVLVMGSLCLQICFAFLKNDRGINEEVYVQGAPHPPSLLMADAWTKPYSRDYAAFPAPWLRSSKFWPTTGVYPTSSNLLSPKSNQTCLVTTFKYLQNTFEILFLN